MVPMKNWVVKKQKKWIFPPSESMAPQSQGDRIGGFWSLRRVAIGDQKARQGPAAAHDLIAWDQF